MDDDHNPEPSDNGQESASEESIEHVTPVGDETIEESPAQTDTVPSSTNDTTEPQLSDSPSETEDPATTTTAAVPVITVDPPAQSPSTASPTLSWEDAANFAAGAFDDEEADAAFRAVIRRQTLPPQTVEQLEAEEARGFYYQNRPRSPVFGMPASDDLYVQSNRVYQNQGIGQFEVRARFRDPGRRNEPRPPSPLRKVRSSEELSPEQSPTEVERNSALESGASVQEATEDEVAVEDSPDDDDEELFEELFGPADGDAAPSSESHQQPATDDVHTLKGSLRVSTDVDTTRRAPPKASGDGHDDTHPGDDSKSPTSAEELEMLTKLSIEDGVRGLQNAYRALSTRSLADHAKTLRLKRQMLAFYTKHQKLNVLDDELLEEACDLGAKAAAHLYRRQRDEFREERNEAREEVVGLVEERDQLARKLRSVDEDRHQLAKVEKDLKREQETATKWKTAYEKLHPLAMIEIERRERREDACTVATQTEAVQAVSSVATQTEADRAPVLGRGASPLPSVQTSQTRVEAPSALPSWNTTMDLVGTLVGGPDAPTFTGTISFGAQTNARWRAREEKIQNTAAWKQNYAAILQRLRAGGTGSAAAISVR